MRVKRFIFSVRGAPVLALAACVAVLASPAAFCSEQAKSKGRVRGHYVRIVGSSYVGTGDGGVGELRAIQRRCVEDKKFMKRPHVASPTLAWPKARTSVQWETYYTRTRTMTISSAERYVVRHSDCDLAVQTIHELLLESGAGRCTVDLTEKTATGHCDVDAHRRATSPVRVDIDQRHIPKGAEKTILGINCIPYIGRLRTVCVGTPRSDFRIPNGPFSRLAPGLLLEERGAYMNADAVAVELDREFHDDLFTIPQGLKHRPFPPVNRPESGAVGQ